MLHDGRRDFAVCADVLVKYKDEVDGDLDFRGTGVNGEVCKHFQQDDANDH